MAKIRYLSLLAFFVFSLIPAKGYSQCSESYPKAIVSQLKSEKAIAVYAHPDSLKNEIAELISSGLPVEEGINTTKTIISRYEQFVTMVETNGLQNNPEYKEEYLYCKDLIVMKKYFLDVINCQMNIGRLKPPPESQPQPQAVNAAKSTLQGRKSIVVNDIIDQVRIDQSIDQIMKNNITVYVLNGENAYLSGNVKSAVELFEKAAQLYARYPRLNLIIGQLYEDMGDLRKALDYYKIYIGPEATGAEQALEKQEAIPARVQEETVVSASQPLENLAPPKNSGATVPKVETQALGLGTIFGLKWGISKSEFSSKVNMPGNWQNEKYIVKDVKWTFKNSSDFVTFPLVVFTFEKDSRQAASSNLISVALSFKSNDFKKIIDQLRITHGEPAQYNESELTISGRKDIQIIATWLNSEINRTAEMRKYWTNENSGGIFYSALSPAQ